METSLTSSRWLRVLVGFGSLVLITAALYFAKEVLVPLVLAVLFTFILTPLVVLLQRLRLPRVPAVVVVVLLTLGVLGGIGLAVYKQLESLAVELPQKKEEIIQKIRSLKEAGQGSVLDRVWSAGRDILGAFGSDDKGPAAARQEPVPVKQVEPRAPTYLFSLASPALEFLLQVVLTLVLTVFMLIQRENMRDRLIRLSGEGSITNMTKALDDAATRLSRFLLTQLCINGAFGTLASVGLWVIGVPYPLVWGLLAGALRYLPYVGAYIGAALPLLLAATLMPSWMSVVWVAVLFVGLELVTANVVEPYAFGHSIGVSEVALLVAAAFWAWLWGPIGLVLSTPLTACLAVLGRYVPGLEFFDVLLGDEPVLSEPVRYYQRLLARDEDEAARLVEEYHAEHCGGQVFDAIFLPALLMTTANRDRNRLTQDDARFILRTTRELVEDIPAAQEEADAKCASEATRRWDAAPATGVPVLACPARHEADELALLMLRQMLDPNKVRLETLSADTLASEVLQKVDKERPAAVVVASLPPHGLTYARYLLKRLRAKFPKLKILVLSLGREDQAERVAARLHDAGADQVATSLAECRDLLLPIVQVMAHSDEQRELAASSSTAG